MVDIELPNGARNAGNQQVLLGTSSLTTENANPITVSPTLMNTPSAAWS